MFANDSRVRVLCAAVALATCGGAVAALQEPNFKAGNRTVAVYATVKNADGRLVPNLPRDAFTIFDKGKRQELTLFANEIQPITVVLLLDRSGSMRANFRLVEQAAEDFVTEMQPGDKARIGSFSDRIQVDPADFTGDHGRLIEILRTDLQPAGPTPLWNAVSVGITALLHQQGRRVVLVFTDGADAPMNGSMKASLKDVMKRAEEEDVMVYAIGLAGQDGRGGRGPYGGGRRGGGGGGRGRGGRGGGMGRGGRGGGSGYGRGRGSATGKPDEGLPKIAAATGGGYYELTSTDNLRSTFARVADELHHQYVLGFTPGVLDGKMHPLEVRLADPGMTARARKSYLARNGG
jgi:VWFA-related protein